MLATRICVSLNDGHDLGLDYPNVTLIIQVGITPQDQ